MSKFLAKCVTHLMVPIYIKKYIGSSSARSKKNFDDTGLLIKSSNNTNIVDVCTRV